MASGNDAGLSIVFFLFFLCCRLALLMTSDSQKSNARFPNWVPVLVEPKNIERLQSAISSGRFIFSLKSLAFMSSTRLTLCLEIETPLSGAVALVRRNHLKEKPFGFSVNHFESLRTLAPFKSDWPLCQTSRNVSKCTELGHWFDFIDINLHNILSSAMPLMCQ